MKKVRRQVDYKKVGKVILMTVAAAGFLSMALMAPNALQALEIFGLGGRRERNARYYIKSTLSRLIVGGCVEVIEKRNGKRFLSLTDKGWERLARYQLGDLKIEEPKRWDGKWRLIIYDIREGKRGRRDLFRSELINLGFVPLQKSVWVYPYECEEVALLLKTGLEMGREVIYMVVERIENDRWLKQEFELV